METEAFDALTRRFGEGGLSRRLVTRELAGTLLGGVVAGVVVRLGPSEQAEAKSERHKTKSRSRSEPHSERTAHGHPHEEGKRKGKKRRKQRTASPPPLPAGCENCNECQMCQDGACVADPALDSVRCTGSGAACGYCQGGVCAASVVPPCADGVCPPKNQCCPEEKRCWSSDSPTGFMCLGADDCCPDQKKCAGTCIYKQACCEAERPQNCGQCGAACHRDGTWGCSAERPCPNGTCIAGDQCCPGQHKCPSDGSCLPDNVCCEGQVACAGAPHGCCSQADYNFDERTGRHYCAFSWWCE